MAGIWSLFLALVLALIGGLFVACRRARSEVSGRGLQAQFHAQTGERDAMAAKYSQGTKVDSRNAFLMILNHLPVSCEDLGSMIHLLGKNNDGSICRDFIKGYIQDGHQFDWHKATQIAHKLYGETERGKSFNHHGRKYMWNGKAKRWQEVMPNDSFVSDYSKLLPHLQIWLECIKEVENNNNVKVFCETDPGIARDACANNNNNHEQAVTWILLTTNLKDLGIYEEVWVAYHEYWKDPVKFLQKQLGQAKVKEH